MKTGWLDVDGVLETMAERRNKEAVMEAIIELRKLKEKGGKKVDIEGIHNDLQELENRLWKLEKQLNEGYLKDRMFEVRSSLIDVLIKIRKLL